MSLKLYTDYASQPCRAVHLLLEVNKVPYEAVVLEVSSGQPRKSEELKKMNMHLLPAIDDNGFGLGESAAILTYLVDKYNLPDHWYPKDLQKRAKIDEYLHWHHAFLRKGCKIFFLKYIYPMMKGCEAEPALIREREETLKTALTRLSDHFLKDSKFIYGDEISVADLQALCEVTQMWMDRKKLEDDYPILKRWVADCQKELGESFDKVHQVVYKLRDNKTFIGGQNSKE